MQDTNFTWPQGEDMVIQLRYKEGSKSSTAVPVNLSAGYDARMTIVTTDASPDVILGTVSGEIVLGTGINEPNITIRLDRAITLSGGELAAGGSFLYDLFLRNVSTDTQIKVLEGTINVRRSYTQWL